MSKITIELNSSGSADAASAEKTKELKFLAVIKCFKKSKGLFTSDQFELANVYGTSIVPEITPGLTEDIIEGFKKECAKELGVKNNNLVILNIIQLAG